jgi:hypothetical protein
MREQVPASDGTHRQVIDVNGQVNDWHAAINYTRNRDDLDPHRLAWFANRCWHFWDPGLPWKTTSVGQQKLPNIC